MKNRELYISQLISRFFRGETSPAEEREIVRFFRSEVGSLPPGLERERAFFLALDDASGSDYAGDAVELPDNVAARIERALDEVAAMGNAVRDGASRKRAFGWRRFVSAAACVAVIALGAMVFVKDGDQTSATHQQTETTMANAVLPAPSEVADNDSSAITTAPAVNPVVREQRLADAHPAKIRKRVPHPASSGPASESVITETSPTIDTEEVSDENLWIVTDPDEARDLMAQILAMLDSRMETGINACQTVDAIISDNLEKAKYTISVKI